MFALTIVRADLPEVVFAFELASVLELSAELLTCELESSAELIACELELSTFSTDELDTLFLLSSAVLGKLDELLVLSAEEASAWAPIWTTLLVSACLLSKILIENSPADCAINLMTKFFEAFGVKVKFNLSLSN